VRKVRIPKTFDIVLRFGNAEAAGGMDPGIKDGADSGVGMEELNAEAGHATKTGSVVLGFTALSLIGAGAVGAHPVLL